MTNPPRVALAAPTRSRGANSTHSASDMSRSTTSPRVTALLVLAAVVGLAVAEDPPQPHDLVVGVRQPGDTLIHHERIDESYQWTGQKQVVTRHITAPAGHVITQVRCLDEATDGTGAEPTITAGGPGLDWVALKFKSQRWRGVYFNVEVYAKPR